MTVRMAVMIANLGSGRGPAKNGDTVTAVPSNSPPMMA
jgi:hypothetical protein